MLDRKGLEAGATALGLNVKAFGACLDSARQEVAIRADVAA
jgi:hypothetical protein